MQNNLGTRLVALRMDRGLRQVDLAEALGVFQSAISEIESGKRPPTLSLLNRWMHALKLTDAERIELLDLAPGAPVTDTVAP
jgi:transcriptional regulator with XRE-family HTH domain